PASSTSPETATPQSYTLSLHDALPIWSRSGRRPEERRSPGFHRRQDDRGGHARSARRARARGDRQARREFEGAVALYPRWQGKEDRKSTRLNSSHVKISYAVFCLKKKK